MLCSTQKAIRRRPTWSTDQVRNELARSREGKVAESLEALRKLRQGGGAPQMARNLPEFDAFTAARREFESQLETLINRVREEYFAEELAADAVLGELLESAETVTVGIEIVEAARRRVDLAVRPGRRAASAML